MRRIPHEQISVLKAEIDKLQKAGAVEPSISPFASPVILVRKKDGTMRLCIDYRKLNAITKKDAHPLPRIEDIFDTLSGSKFFSTLDMAMGYHQVEVNPDDREKTAFTTPFGLFQYKVMPFGLATAPATFMRLMTIVFSGMLYNTCLAYLDDIIIFGRTFEEHLQRLDLALTRVQGANLKLKPSKCRFGQKSVNFLGHVISDKGISTDPEKLRKIQEWPRPRNVNETRSFLGYATYYRKFIRNFSSIAQPLNKLLQKDYEFKWTEQCEQSLNLIKKAFSDVITLAYPDFTKPFTVDCDASDFGIGGVLSQEYNGVEQPIAYFSRSLSKAERKYAVTRKEMLGLVDSLRHFRCYVLGKKFRVRTDHSALQWLRTFKEPVGQVARWIERLAEYDFDIVHRPGKQHSNADALSRYPVSVVTMEESWFGPALKADFRKQQAKDTITSELLRWVSKGSRPKSERMDGAPQELRYYWARFDELSVEDGILGIRTAIDDGPETAFRAVVPRSSRQFILELAHASPAGGHFGVQKTIDKLKQRVHWISIAKSVREWCAKCPTCNRHKCLKRNKAPLQPIFTGGPFERVAMDIVGPLPRTARGNRYILTVVDHFTKHVEAYPLPDQEAASIARVFLNEFVARFGVPYVVHTDQGANFESSLMKELCKVLGIAKTRTTPYHPQCDGQVERMNRVIIELLALNVQNPTDNWDLELGLTLMAYRSAVQTSTGFTPHYLLFGREMRLPLDIIFRPPDKEQSHQAFVGEVREHLHRAYDTARDRLQLAHHRQKDYYDRRTHGDRYKVGDSVWLWSPVLEKGVAHKFHEPWTGPMKISKKISDVTYEVHDLSKNSKKIVHFDRLRKAAVRPRRHNLSESEPEELINSESDSDSLSPPPVERIPQAQAKRKTTPTTSHRPKTGEQPLDPAHRQSEPATADPATVQHPLGPKAEARVEPNPVPQCDAHGPRVSARVNKGVAPRRYSPSSNAVLIVLALFYLFASASGQDVILLQSYGAVAEKAGQVAIDEGPAFFSMVLRMHIPHEETHMSQCLPDMHQDRFLELDNQLRMPTWMSVSTDLQDASYTAIARKPLAITTTLETPQTEPQVEQTTPTESGTTEEDQTERVIDAPLTEEERALLRRATDSGNEEHVRKKRFLPFLFGVGAIVSAVISTANTAYTVVQLNAIRSKLNIISQHVSEMSNEVSAEHDQLVTISKATDSLYEYTHKNFREISESLNRLSCADEEIIDKTLWLIHRTRIRLRLYSDFDSAVTAVFEGHPTPILTPLSAINQLISENNFWFNNTIYLTNPHLIYQYGSVHPVLPLRYGVIGYVLSLPRIIVPHQTTLYQITSNGIINLDKIYRYKLPRYAVKIDNKFKEIDIFKCQGLRSDIRLCSKSIHIVENSCLQNQSNCEFELKDYKETQLAITIYGYLLATKALCSENSVSTKHPKVIPINGVLFQPFNFTGALVCSDGLSVPSESRYMHFDLHYTEPFIHQLPHPSNEYKVEDWMDYSEVKMLETSLASQVIKTYTAFSRDNQQWIWPIIMIITTLLLITSITAAVYCYCKGCEFPSRNHSFEHRRVSYRAASHHSLHPLPIVQPVSVVAEVTPQVTVELVESPAPTLRKKTPKREKRQLRTRSTSSSADERPITSEPIEPEGGLDF